MREINIIIPVYNAGLYLERLMDSILKQTFVDKLEVFFINDGSTDDSEDICKKYSKKYHFVHYFYKENGGVSSARNLGLEKITGKYVSFLDADDYIDFDYYEILYNLIEENKCDIAMVDMFVYKEGNKEEGYKKRNIEEYYSDSKTKILSDFFSGYAIGVNLVDKLFKRELFKNIRFDESIRIGEDRYFLFETLMNTNRIIGKFYPKYFYCLREGSAMFSRFDEKYLDTVKAARFMLDKVNDNIPELYENAYAQMIYEECKVIEYMYLGNGYREYKKLKKQLLKDIKKYPILKAKHFFVKRKFYAFILMKFSPTIYMMVKKLLKLN